MSLDLRFEQARLSKNPFEALHQIAKELRDAGVSQIALYQIFEELFLKSQEQGFDDLEDVVGDVLDCIWSGGWAIDSLALFSEVLDKQGLEKYRFTLEKKAN